MKILYVANVRMPTEKAHGLQIMKTCEAFADLGHEVTLIVPYRRNKITEDPFMYYRVRKNFSINYVSTWDLVEWGSVGFIVQSVTFALSAVRLSFSKQSDVIYGRDELPLLAFSMLVHTPFIWETHVGAWNIAARFIAKRARGIVAISNGLKRFYTAHGVEEAKIVVAPDGVDLEKFARAESKEAARTRLGLPMDKKVALYIGRLDGWKGADTFCEAASLLPEDIVCAVIGGEPSQIEVMQAKYPKVRFLGYRPYVELPKNQAAADVLVLPNTGKDRTSAEFTSPLKLFTYMASGIPIVASDLSSIREVLSDRMAFFATPDNPSALAGAIIEAVNSSKASERAQSAQ